MDQHAWAILQRSLGNLEYGVDFNREVEKIASPENIPVIFERLLRFIKVRMKPKTKAFPSGAAPRDEKGCHAC